MAQVRVTGVGVDAGTGDRVVLLQETAGAGRIVVVAVGEPEALAAAAALEGVAGARPGTHRLIGAVLEAAGRRLVRVRVHTLRDRVFHAELDLDDGTRVDSRTSDAIVLALLLGADIEVADAVLTVAGVDPAAVTVHDDGGRSAELDAFRRFLDSAVPDDFEERD
ncbi:bifunctional nuclease family protein [Pseudonocardia sp. ICBG1293]|uniref:bifunctional nuclease family protein n=1 Tax=Pseudonocardia sp. ICBG1293 TaxID=2844382 RepID=UPI001CCF0960|nr:bifunctional nuclease domain-containing protein [Pseudonocardia sp. ICBG1293]